MAKSLEPGRSTANRMFAVLGAFENRREALTLSRIAEVTGLPVTTTHRVTKELLAVGALERDTDGRFQIGLRLWQLGSLAPRQRDLRYAARPLMESLHEATGLTVQLVIFERRRALCVEKISGTRSAANVTEVAGALPLHATGVGKVILAFSNELDPSRAIRLPRYTEATIVDSATLAAEIDRVRESYVAYCREEMTVGTASLAAPVFGADGDLVAALGVLTPPVDLAGLVSAVRTAALGISRRLGYDPVSWPIRSER
ncbi:IclR family transcriptional regulator [Agromyces bauzanensis]